MNIRYPIYEGVYRILTIKQGNTKSRLSSAALCATSFFIAYGKTNTATVRKRQSRYRVILYNHCQRSPETL